MNNPNNFVGLREEVQGFEIVRGAERQCNYRSKRSCTAVGELIRYRWGTDA